MINQKQKDLILSNRSLMIGMTSADHWLRLKPKLRKIFLEALTKMSHEDLAKIIGFKTETIVRWSQEFRALEELKLKVAKCKSTSKSGHVSNSILIRADVCALVAVASKKAIIDELGVSRSSLDTWLQSGWDKRSTPEESETFFEEITTSQPKGKDFINDETTVQLKEAMHRHDGKVRRKYSPSEKRLLSDLLDRFGSKLVHDYFGVSYDTIARIKRRKDEEVDRKARTPMRYIPVIDLMKKHPGMGPMQIRDYIRRHLGLSMGVASIRKIMENHGWVPPFVKVTRFTGDLKSYEAARRNYLWHADFKHQYINSCKVFLLLIQDDYSRFIVGYALCDGEKIDLVLTAFDESIRIHGRPEAIMTDGGSAFFSWRGNSKFTKFLEDFGIEQLVAETPNINGKLENLNAQIEKELILPTSFASVSHFRNELNKWVGFYNFSRPHQGLGGKQVPADRFYPGAMQWFGTTKEVTKQQALIAETMVTLLSDLKKYNNSSNE